MRIIALVLLATAWLLPTPGFGGATYVFFYQERGPWTVLCGEDEVLRKKVCELSAPPPALGIKQNVIFVEATGRNGFRIRIQVRDLVVRDMPVRLQVDSGPVFETTTSQGEAVWDGKTAGSIVEAMRTGGAVTYTVPVAPNGAPRSTLVPLEQFGAALEVYQQVLEAHGLV